MTFFSKSISHKLILLTIIALYSLSLSSCGIYRPTDARTIPTDGLEKARKNVQEGRGISLKNMMGDKKTTYEFATSNPLWRASLNTLDFLPLSNVDYSGGVLITDWYSDNFSSNTFLKITINFLSNEVRSDSLKIIIHQKKCENKNNNNCIISLIKSNIETELRRAIISKAIIFEKELKK